MLITRIEAETKQEDKKQARYNEHIEFEKDYRRIFADRKKTKDKVKI
jgi:hypothetical protein